MRRSSSEDSEEAAKIGNSSGGVSLLVLQQQPTEHGENAVLANEGILRQILNYVGPKHYRFVALVNRQWLQTYAAIHNGETTTSRSNALTASSKRALTIFCLEHNSTDNELSLIHI